MSDGDALHSALDGAGLLPAGMVVGDYQIVRSVGAGGMAVVYEARHRTLNKRVALKVLDSGHAGSKAELAKRFLREAENAARLEHRHVVDVSNVGVANGVPYLVMEFLEGEDLSEYLQRRGKLSVEASADLIVPVVCAIAAAHEAGVVHRDLKPQNIFLCKSRNSDELIPKVVDFGISKLVDGASLQLTGTNAILGTPFYMSPEQAMEAKNVDGRTDQFSLGVILYECVTGRRPFEGDSLFTVLTAIVHLDHNPPSSLTYPLDAKFEALVDRALKKTPGERFESMQALGRELLRFASLRVQMTYAAELKAELPPALRKEAERLSSGPPSKPAKRKGGRPHASRWLALGAALLTLAGLAAWWSLREDKLAPRAPVPALPTPAPLAQPEAVPDTSDWAAPPPTVVEAAPAVPTAAPEQVPAPAPVTPTPVRSERSASAPGQEARPSSSPARTTEAPVAPRSEPAPREPRKPERGANRALILQ